MDDDEQGGQRLAAVLAKQTIDRQSKRDGMLEYDLADLADVFGWFEKRARAEVGDMRQALEAMNMHQQNTLSRVNLFGAAATVLLLLILWRVW